MWEPNLQMTWSQNYFKGALTCNPHNGLLFLSIRPNRLVVVLYDYAPTTASSLVKPRAESLANVLPVMFTTDF